MKRSFPIVARKQGMSKQNIVSHYQGSTPRFAIPVRVVHKTCGWRTRDRGIVGWRADSTGQSVGQAHTTGATDGYSPLEPSAKYKALFADSTLWRHRRHVRLAVLDVYMCGSSGCVADRPLFRMCRTKYKHDARTTYCYYITDKYTSKTPASDDSDILVQDVGTPCPVKITVEIADKLTKNSLIYVKYTVRIDDANKDPNFEFPVPVKASVVPDYLLKNSSSVNATKLYDVAVSNVVMCDWGKCDIFTALDGIGNSYSSTNNPNNFVDKSVVFGSQEIIIPKDGKYTGFAHIVINIGGNSRADFVTFFPVQVGDVVGTAPTEIATDSKTTYCWTAKDVSPFDPSINSDLTVRTDKNCPGSMKSAISKKSVLVDESVDIDWTLQIDTLTSDTSSLIAEVSTTDAIVNPRTGIYSVVPVSVLSGCRRNTGKTCSSYSGGTSGTVDIKEFDDYNLTNGIASYTTNHSFSEVGDYTLISRVAMLTTDGARIDMAVYSTVSVTLPETTGGSVFLYVGLGIGGLILLAGLLFCIIKKRRAKEDTKSIPFRQPGAATAGPVGIATPLDRFSSNTGASSSNFLTHKSPAQGRAVLGYANEPTFIMDGGGVDHSQLQHMDHGREDDSFSLDPYSRPSFNDMDESDDEHDDATIRPSEMNKFSFQSGYDDESDWEFDTRSHRTDGQFSADFSDVQRGTFQMQPGGGNLPILEEDDDRLPPAPSRNEGPRTTAGSGWTMR